MSQSPSVLGSFHTVAGTHQVLLIRVFRVEQVDEAAHEALLLGKVLGVGVVGGLVGLVLDQRGHQVQDGVHLEKPEGRGEG